MLPAYEGQLFKWCLTIRGRPEECWGPATFSYAAAGEPSSRFQTDGHAGCQPFHGVLAGASATHSVVPEGTRRYARSASGARGGVSRRGGARSDVISGSHGVTDLYARGAGACRTSHLSVWRVVAEPVGA